MRHFAFLPADEEQRLFLRAPEPFAPSDDPAVLATALGATLYCPGTRPTLARDLSRRSAEGVVSFVVCLEDSVADGDLARAEDNAIAQLRQLAAAGAPSALVFVRVRTATQIRMLIERLGDAQTLLAGFVLPKFTDEHGAEQLDAIVELQQHVGRTLFAMPVLEAPEMIYAESRVESLASAKQLVDKYRDNVLAVRVGATDLASAYGLRRARDLTTYDVRVVADALSDIVNVFGRAGDGYVVTGPVWEYFARTERMFKPQLRMSPFVEHAERTLRANLIANDLDGLIREIALDHANGLLGKSVIHPSHVAPVHALSVVTHEEYLDACDVLDAGSSGGAAASLYRNKMNESKPHLAWAARTALRARVFGVAAEGVSFVDLLGACLSR